MQSSMLNGLSGSEEECRYLKVNNIGLLFLTYFVNSTMLSRTLKK